MIAESPELIDRQGQWVASFVKRGSPFISACAATGNATQENLAKPVTTGAKDHGSDGGFQWRLDRLDGPQGLKGYCATKGLDWQTIDAQAEFFLFELKRDYVALYAEFMAAAKPLATLTANICAVYERPAADSAALDNRIAAAQFCFDHFSAQYTDAPQPAPAPVVPPASVADSLDAALNNLRVKKATAANAAALVQQAQAEVEAVIADLQKKIAEAQKEIGP